MRKNTLLFKSVLTVVSFLVFSLSVLNSNAQACGASGPSVCTPQAGVDTAGFYPTDTLFPCVTDAQAYNQVLTLFAPSSVSAGGSTYQLDSIVVASISNLPCGLCWNSNNVRNTFVAGKAGCIRITGISNEATGNYDAIVYATAYVHLFGGSIPLGPLNVDSALGLNYYIRVNEPGQNCPPVDSATQRKASTAGSITTPTITGGTTICGTGSTTLTATGASYYGYAWSNGTFGSSITVTTGGTYTVTVYENCASATASVNVTALTGATITPGGPTTFCAGGSVVLTANTGGSYLWSNGATTQSITVTASGSFTVKVTSGTCSFTSSATAVVVNKLPTATIAASGPTSFCKGGSVTLTAKAGAGYSWAWSTGATSEAITVSATGSYIVTATAKGCSKASVAKKVTVTALPAASITTTGTICPSGTETLTEKKIGTDTYLWNTAATTNVIKVTTAGTYTVTVTGSTALHCSASASKVVASCGAVAGKTDGINTTENSGFQASVYPNPYSGQFNVKIQTSNTTDNVNVKIYDVTGKMMEERLNVAANANIMLGNGYAAGVYIVRVQQGSTTRDLRIVKAE